MPTLRIMMMVMRREDGAGKAKVGGGVTVAAAGLKCTNTHS